MVKTVSPGSWQSARQLGGAVAGDVYSVGAAFTPTNYSADKSVTNTPAGEAIASGAAAIMVVNQSATDTIRIAFGLDVTDAIANVTAGGVPVLPSSERTCPIPQGAGAVAWINDAAGPATVYIGQGT